MKLKYSPVFSISRYTRPLLTILALAGVISLGFGPWGAASAQLGEKGHEAAAPSSVLLGEGMVLQANWKIYVKRARTVGTSHTTGVCLTEVLRFSDGVRSRGSACGQLSPPSDAPVFTLSSLSINGRDAAVIGAVFGHEVHKVLFDLSGKSDQMRRTKLLTGKQAQRAQLPPLRYATFDVAKDVCLRGFTLYNKAGEVLRDTERYSCGGPVVKEIPVKD